MPATNARKRNKSKLEPAGERTPKSRRGGGPPRFVSDGRRRRLSRRNRGLHRAAEEPSPLPRNGIRLCSAPGPHPRLQSRPNPVAIDQHAGRRDHGRDEGRTRPRLSRAAECGGFDRRWCAAAPRSPIRCSGGNRCILPNFGGRPGEPGHFRCPLRLCFGRRPRHQN